MSVVFPIESVLSNSRSSRISLTTRVSLAEENLGAAVCTLNGPVTKGLVRFVQVTETCCVIDGTITGMLLTLSR